MLESKFEKKCIEELRALPCSYWPPKVESLSVRGEPDRVGCVNGHFVALEFKRSEAEAKRQTGRVILQKQILNKIKMAGGVGFVAYPENWDFVLKQIKGLL